MFKNTPLPSQMTLDHARDLAIEMGCTHHLTSSVPDRANDGLPIVLATYFGSMHPERDDRFIEAFHLGLQSESIDLRNVHDFRHLQHGGREWHPDFLHIANCYLEEIK